MNKLNRFLIVVSLTCFCHCSKDTFILEPEKSYYVNTVTGYRDSVLRVLTYNIQLGFTSEQDPFNENVIGGSPSQIHDLANIIRKANPNIVLLQEVPENRCNTIVKAFVEALADSLHMNYAFGYHGNEPDKCKGIWGGATLSKFPIKNIDVQPVRTEGKYSARTVLKTALVLNDSSLLNVYNLHHDGKDTGEIRKTMDFVHKSAGPYLIGGDFNRTYYNPELKLPADDYFSSLQTGIDRIYGTVNATMLDYGSIFNSNKVSDHYAEYVILKLN